MKRQTKSKRLNPISQQNKEWNATKMAEYIFQTCSNHSAAMNYGSKKCSSQAAPMKYLKKHLHPSQGDLVRKTRNDNNEK